MERYVSIYKLACRFEIDAAKESAKAGIEQLRCVQDEPVKLLHLAQVHGIEEWFEAAFHQLLLTRISCFTKEDRSTLGTETLLVIASMRDALDAHRRTVAKFPPPVQHSTTCIQKDHAECEKAYMDMWWKLVEMPLLDPKFDTPTSQVPEIVAKAIGVEMNPRCWEMTRTRILARKQDPAFSAEEVAIQKVLKKLKGERSETPSDIIA